MKYIYNDAVIRNYNPSEQQIIAGLNASFTSNDNLSGSTVGQLLSDDAFVVQSLANVNSSGIPWGDYYSNVINVGAWNVDNQGYALAAEISTLSALDILADGYVEKAGWGNGWNFGTSFATPRVFAEIINFYDENLSPLIENGEIEVEPGTDITDEELTEVTNATVEVISTDVDVKFSGMGTFLGPFNVLSDDINQNIYPTLVPTNLDEFGLTIQDAKLSSEDFINLPANWSDPVITFDDDGDGIIEVGETITVTYNVTDADGIANGPFKLGNIKRRK